MSKIVNSPNIIQETSSGTTYHSIQDDMLMHREKGNLVDELGPMLRDNGYRILHLNFKDLRQSCGYNPMDYIRFDEASGKYRTQDILTIAQVLSPTSSKADPFWDQAAKMYLTSLIAYAMECLPENEHNLKIVADLYGELHTSRFAQLIDDQKKVHPDSYAVRCYSLFQNAHTADRTEASITTILGEKLNGLLLEEAIQMYTAEQRIDFCDLAREKTAVFLTISDTDRSMDRLVSLYGKENATTIVNNCDNMLYLGGQDVETAQLISPKMNLPVSTILNTGLDEAYLFTRGTGPRKVRKYDLRTHPRYFALAEAQEEQPPEAPEAALSF